MDSEKLKKIKDLEMSLMILAQQLLGYVREVTNDFKLLSQLYATREVNAEDINQKSRANKEIKKQMEEVFKRRNGENPNQLKIEHN